MSSKLNWLINNTSPGSIVLQSWLSSNGISPQLALKYSQSHWLHKLRAGVYVRPGRQPHWQDALHCLNHQHGTHAHLAGLTSLTQQGKSHYLQLTTDSVWLGVPAKTILPKWFKSLSGIHLSEVNSNEPETSFSEEIFPCWKIIKTSKLAYIEENDLITVDINGVKLTASNQELAAFELLDAVPKSLSFEYAADLFQGLVNLSPRKVESILKRSASIQTNRLFLFLGHFYKHPWIERVNESLIELGSGKRQVVTNGKLEKQYQITVPKQFIESEQYHG